MKNDLILSGLGHTWIFDLDGTILKHNGYLADGCDKVLCQAKNFIEKIPDKDLIIILTSRDEKFRSETEKFLAKEKIRYNHIIFNAPFGERILINDEKPSGLKTAISINTKRDSAEFPRVIEDNNL